MKLMGVMNKMDRLIGFSTGVLFHLVNPVSEEIFQICYDMGCNHVDIHAHTDGDVDELLCNEKSLGAYVCERFKSRSVHLPAMAINKDNALYFARAITMFLSQDAHVVIHPDHEHDFDEIITFFPRIAVENMDNRKKTFRTLQDMRDLFTCYPKLSFCLDVQHWVVNGNFVYEIPEIINEFGDKITCVHLSGVGEDGYHAPICRTGQHDLIKSLKSLPPNVPIILEPVCEDVDEMHKEFNLVEDILS